MPSRLISKGRKVQRFLTIQPSGSVQKLKAGFGSLPQGPELKARRTAGSWATRSKISKR